MESGRGLKDAVSQRTIGLMALSLSPMLAALFASCAVAGGLSWPELNEAAAAAYKAKDYVGYRARLIEMAQIAPSHPEVVYKMAGAEALLGNTAAALARLGRFAAMGVSADAASDSAFAPLRSRREFQGLVRRIERNNAPVSHSEKAFSLPDAELLSEDIAFDPANGTFYFSSVHRRKIIGRSRDGRVFDFIGAGQDGAWGMMALGLDAKRRVLWATTTALDRAEGHRPADEGRSALLKYDLDRRTLLARYDARGPGRHALGDMTLGPAGEVVVSDSAGGGIYRLASGQSALETLAPPGAFLSPQTPAFAPDGRRVFIADYVRGIGVVDLASRQVTWLATAPDLAASGIDGLYFAGDTLLALQNGTTPQRVLRLWLDAPMRRVVRWEVIERKTPALSEPTHGVLTGNDFYYIGSSGWEPGAPVILRTRANP